MIIRCPHCEFARTVGANKIPPTAEVATCPKCRQRFRFRTLEPDEKPSPPPPAPPKERAPADIWEAVDALARNFPLPEKPPAKANQAPAGQSRSVAKTTPPGNPASPVEVLPGPAPVNAVADEAPPTDESTAEQTPADPTHPKKAAPTLRTADAEPSAEEPAPVVFPYAEDDTPPEERVERDLRMLKKEEENRPTRDLGHIDEWSEANTAGAVVEEDAPWEDPGKHGRLGGWLETLRRTLLGPAHFFAGLCASGSLAPAYLFFIIQSYVALLFTLLWSLVASITLNDSTMFTPPRMGLPIMLLIAPLVVGLSLLFCAGAARTFLRITAPEKADFPGIFKILCYSSAAFLFCVIPFLGPVLAWAWFSVVLVGGFRHGLRLSWPLALLTAIIPAVLLPGSMALFFL